MDLSRASRLRGKSIRVVIAPALAAAALTLAAFGMAWRSDLSTARDRIQAMQEQLVTTGARVQAMQEQLVTTGARVQAMQEQLVTTGARVRTISFEEPGTDGASARGELVRQSDGNHRIVLWTKGLPPTRAGEYYEVWLSGKGRWVSAGSFQVAGEVWSCPVGVSPAANSKVWVTLEPDDGNPLPRKDRSVLQATL
jgi:hypothetical protein